MNLPNILSVFRIPMVFLIAWLMIINTPLANRWALGIFILSALTDWLDGYLARRLQQITDFGKFADALADKVLTAGLFVSLAALQRLPESWGLLAVLLIITREFMVTGLRLVAAGRGLVMAAEGLGKFKTLLQMVSIGLFLLLPIIDEKRPIILSKWNHPSEVLFAVATMLTLISGVSYFWKNRVVFQDSPIK